MNLNVLKILEHLGYTLINDQHGLKILDKNKVELKKENFSESSSDGIKYYGRDGQEIYFDSEGYVQIKVDNHMTIVAYNLYNERNEDSIRIFYSELPNYDYVVNFDINRSRRNDVNGYILASAHDNPLFLTDDSKDSFLGCDLEIEDKNDGAIVYLANKEFEHIDINKCTVEKYLRIVERFLNRIGNELNRDDINRGFEIIKPCVKGLITDLITRRKFNEKQVVKTKKKKH